MDEFQEPSSDDPRAFENIVTGYKAAIDQLVEISKPAMQAVAEYHAACVSVGVPPAVAHVLALRFAARMLVLPPRSENAWGGPS